MGAKSKTRYERAYNKKGFHCAVGRMRRLQPKPPAPPPAPPAPPAPPRPAALEGRYVFTTSQSNAGSVSVLAGGRSFSNFVIPYFAPCVQGGASSAS